MSRIMCHKHRSAIMRFLLQKTAAVYRGVKPGELLRLKHCYPLSGSPECLCREDIFAALKLDYLILREDGDGALVLFFDRKNLVQTLNSAENMACLGRYGYLATDDLDAHLARLKRNFAGRDFPHEIGIFIGYPAKDVIGFIEKAAPTAVAKGDWRVFGDAGESVNRMRLYRKVFDAAGKIFDRCDNLQTFFNEINRWHWGNVS